MTTSVATDEAARRSEALLRPACALVFLFGLALLTACGSSPRFQGMDSHEIFSFGVEAMEEENWDRAEAAFERVLTMDPGFPRRAEARMNLARAYFGNGEYILAANEFELVLLRHPTFEAAPEASLGICRSYHRLSPIPPRDQEYTRRAEDACRRTANEYRDTEHAEEADSIRREMTDRLAQKWYDEGRFYQRRNLHPPALIVFQDIVDYYPQTRWAPRAMMGLYRSYEAMGWTEEMNEAAQRLLLLYPDSEEAQILSRERADGDG